MPVQDEGRFRKKQPGNRVQARGRAPVGCLPLKAKMGKRLVSNPVILVPVLINFEGLGASLNTRERSRVDVYFPPFPFKDNFIKSLCFHSGSNMGHLNGKIIILPCLLMVRGESGKGGMPMRGRGWQLWAGTHVHAHTCSHSTYSFHTCSHMLIHAQKSAVGILRQHGTLHHLSLGSPVVYGMCPGVPAGGGSQRPAHS